MHHDEMSFPALATLLAPFDVRAFVDTYWERAPLHVSRPGSPLLLTLSELDAIVTTGLHRHPDFTLADASRPVDADDYSSSEGFIDTPKAIKRFGEGASIVLNRLDEWSPRVRELCVRLEAELGFGAQANLYLTPGGAQGFPVHYDSHDVIILQCEGRKRWRLYDMPVGLPMQGEHFDRDRITPGALTATFETCPGDALYIPRGLMHDAVAVDGQSSLHVTVGIHAVRWSALLIEAIAKASLTDPELRRGIAPGTLVRGDDASMQAALRAHAERAARSLHWEPVREHFTARLRGDHKESLGGMLLDVARSFDEGAVFEARTGVLATVSLDGEAVILSVNGRGTRWPAHAETTLRKALSLGRFSLEELGDDLDLAGRATLVRRLVSEGAVRTVPRA